MKRYKFRILVTFITLLTSFIYGLVHIVLFTKIGSSYTPLALSEKSRIARDEAFAYAPEVNYILKGNIFLGEVYVSEYENYPTPFMGESAPSLVFAFLSKLTGSIENAFIAADFIFPPVLFLLLFIITNSLIKNKLFSVAVAFLTVIARDFIAVIPFPYTTLQYLTAAENQSYLLYFSRSFHPQMTFVFFSLAFIFFNKLVKYPKKKYILAFGLFLGILFYSYIFYWTYFLAFLGLFTIYLLVKREKEALLAVTLSIFVALIIAGPYLYNIYKFYQLELAADFIRKSSLANVPLPVTLIRYFSIALLFLFMTRKKGKEFNIFSTFIFAGVLITPVSKLILDQDLETFHYLRRALQPFATIALFTIVYFFLRSRQNILNAISITVITIFMIYGINVQTIASSKIQSAHSRNPNMFDTFNWLKSNTPHDSVVASLNTDLQSLIPVYTQNRVFFPPTDRTVMPTTESVTRYALLNNLIGIQKSTQKKNLENIMSYLFVYQSYNENLDLDPNSPGRKFAEDEIERVSNTNWREEVNRFKLDYIVLTDLEKQIANPDIKLTPTASFGEYKIYKYEK